MVLRQQPRKFVAHEITNLVTNASVMVEGFFFFVGFLGEFRWIVDTEFWRMSFSA
jgi:hypothetical protein